MASHNSTMSEKTTHQIEITNTPRESSIEDAWSSNNWYTIAVVGTGLLIFMALSIVRRHQKNVMLKKKEEDYLHYFHTILPHSTIYGKIEHKPTLMEMMQKGLNGLTNIYTDLYMLQQLHGRPSAADISEQRTVAASSSLSSSAVAVASNATAQQVSSISSISDVRRSDNKSKTGNVSIDEVTIEIERPSNDAACLMQKPTFYLGSAAEHPTDVEEDTQKTVADADISDEAMTTGFSRTNQRRYEQLFASTKTADLDTEEGRTTIRNNARQFLKLNLAMISENDSNDHDEDSTEAETPTRQLMKRSSMPALNNASVKNILVTEL